MKYDVMAKDASPVNTSTHAPMLNTHPQEICTKENAVRQPHFLLNLFLLLFVLVHLQTDLLGNKTVMQTNLLKERNPRTFAVFISLL